MKRRKVLNKVLGVILVALLMLPAMASLPGVVNAETTLPTPEMISPGTDTAADGLSGTKTVSAVQAPSPTAWSETYGGESTNYATVGEVTLKVDVTPTDRGTTSPAPGTYTYTQGDTVLVTAVPNANSVLAFWMLDGTYSGAANPITVTMDRPHHLEAYLNSKPTLNVTSALWAWGLDGTTVPAPGTYTYNYGDNVSVTAIPDGISFFSGWLLDDTFRAENPITVTMDKSHFLTAWFTVQPRLNVAVFGGTAVPAHGIHTYNYGDTVSVMAIPETGYTLEGWIISISIVEATGYVMQNPITITMNGYYKLSAVWTTPYWGSNYDGPLGPTGALSIYGMTGGTTSPAPGYYTYNYRDTVSVTAIPDAGYTFQGWFINGFHVT